ncbi:peptidase T [Limnospira fusiformis SAG 85.79]|uniref:Peptidase T n=1 Tax=Limnospira indica PCC 8005 TaxID=376219 RepID=A0A9P1KF32_9CYAN|nr:peptidase T [Arthrospira platensis C1]QJB26970.1 peptidase T [Limnospira fusiformis SAG 85.79]RAQ42749.1 peptidase T [Arthrospira sp. O9.13F]CDM94753.1 Peptidase T [Limnospira indica PCC 8005]
MPYHLNPAYQDNQLINKITHKTHFINLLPPPKTSKTHLFLGYYHIPEYLDHPQIPLTKSWLCA